MSTRAPEIVNAHVGDRRGTSLVVAHRFLDIPRSLRQLLLNYDDPRCEFVRGLAVFRDTTDEFVLRVDLRFPGTTWKKPWSIKEFSDALVANLKAKSLPSAVEPSEQRDDLGLGFGFTPAQSSQVVRELVDYAVDLIVTMVGEVEEGLVAAGRSDALVTYFSFPSTCRSPANSISCTSSSF